MRSDRWQRVAELYIAVLEKEPSEREAFLIDICDGDLQLHHEIKDLLRHHAVESPLDRPLRIPQDVVAELDHTAIGTRIGPYRIDQVLGAGGTGTVYRARDERLDREVAIKRVPARHAGHFQHEARAIAALNHPHICQIHDVGTDYLVLEFIDGVPLKGPLPLDEVIRLAIQVADALEEAHRHGILHRDLKPHNILVTATGNTKLLDFGLATLLDDASDRTTARTGAIAGTPAYMSPEQAEDRPLDVRSDIFSFGAVVYEMLSGRRAFTGATTKLVLEAVVKNDTQATEVPTALGGIVRRCLRKQPAERFQTMADVGAALKRLTRAVGAPATMDEEPSIAVLPFANLSGNEENDFFSDGLAEEILNALTRLPGLRVTARTSAFAFKGKNEDIRRIAEALGVKTVLEGTVRRADNTVRVTATLINASDGFRVWSGQYHKELTDVFAIQEEIAAGIAAALRITLSEPATRLHGPAPSLAAYEAYLKGRYQHSKFTPASLQKAQTFYEEAVSLEPRFALVHSHLSEHFLMRALIGAMPAHDAMPAARASAMAALEIDSRLPEAQAMVGVVAAIYELDWRKADRWCSTALSHDKVSPWVRYVCGCWHLLVVGRVREAIVQLRRGLVEDPLNLQIRWSLAMCHVAAGRDDDAACEWRQIVEIDDQMHPTYFFWGAHHAFRGRLTEARECAERAHALAPWNLSMRALLAGVLVRTGHVRRGNQLLEAIGDGSGYRAAEAYAVFHVVCGEMDRAASWFERAIAERHPEAIWMLGVANLNPIRSSTEWPRLASLMNLPT